MNKKWLLGLTVKEVVVSTIGALVASIILSGVDLFSGILKWNELIALRVIAILAGELLLCAMIILVTRTSSRRNALAELAQKHAEEIEVLSRAAAVEISALRKKHDDDFKIRTQEHHLFNHKARDIFVQLSGPIDSTDRSDFIIPKEFHPSLEKLLDRMQATFKSLVPPNTKVFTAIRERRGSEYITIARGGEVNKEERQAGTEPLHPQNKMLDELLHSFNEEKECVILSGQDHPNWHKNRKNNSRQEDMSVLMGAVFSKEWCENPSAPFKPVRLEWILSVASDKSGALNENHKPLMRCFTDVCGLLVNAFVRQHPAQKPPANSTTEFRRKPKPSPTKPLR